jgi:hypothetical protein
MVLLRERFHLQQCIRYAGVLLGSKAKDVCLLCSLCAPGRNGAAARALPPAALHTVHGMNELFSWSSTALMYVLPCLESTLWFDCAGELMLYLHHCKSGVVEFRVQAMP